MIVPVAESDEAAVIVVWEAAKELNEHIVHSAFTSLNLGVFRAVEHNREIRAVDSTLAVGVEFVEALLDAVSACFVWLASNADNELVEVDEAVLGGVEVLEQDGGLTLRDVAAEILEAPVQLLLVQESVVVGVDDLEGAA